MRPDPRGAPAPATGSGAETVVDPAADPAAGPAGDPVLDPAIDPAIDPIRDTLGRLVLFGFRLGETWLAAPLSSVEEVAQFGARVPLPGAAPWIEGVARLHGHVVPVLDLGAIEGIARSGEPRRWLILRIGSARLAVGADEIAGPLYGARPSPGPAALPHAVRRVRYEQREHLVLDPHALVAHVRDGAGQGRLR